MNIHFKKALILLIIALLIGFTPAYAIEVSESYPTIDPMDLKGKGIENATNASLQSTNYTCGPAALATVSKDFGVNTSEKELAMLAGTDESGTTMGGLIQAAQEKGLNAAALNLKVDELKSNNIALVTINGTPHYTVVKEITPDGFLLSDPSLGNVKISKEDFASIYSGYALIVNSDDFNEINQDLMAFSKKSELTYTEFLKAYESLKQNLSRLEKAYDTGDETKIKDALAEYNQSKENFLEIKNQLILLKREEEALGSRIISFIERGVISGTYSGKFLDEGGCLVNNV